MRSKNNVEPDEAANIEPPHLDQLACSFLTLHVYVIKLRQSLLCLCRCFRVKNINSSYPLPCTGIILHSKVKNIKNSCQLPYTGIILQRYSKSFSVVSLKNVCQILKPVLKIIYPILAKYVYFVSHILVSQNIFCL